MNHIIQGKTYTITGQDVFLAHRRGEMWLLENLNKSWRGNGAGVFNGYIFKDGVLYEGEYSWERRRIRWEQSLTAVNQRDFEPVGVQIKIIDFTQ